MKKDLKKIRAYGDHLDDGKIQISFTLPIATPAVANDVAKESAKLYLEGLGLKQVQIVWMEKMGHEFTFFVAYAHTEHTIDVTKITSVKPEFPILAFDDLITLWKDKIGKKIVVVGGTTGSDAHTVGIDAILSMKGLAGDKGLEYYPCFKVVNLRAQVSNDVLIQKAAELSADAILVSQVVTQQNQHLENLKDLHQKVKKEPRLSKHLLQIAGGPRMDHRIAKSIGFHAGFGPGTKPSEVANFIVHEIIHQSSHHSGHQTGHQASSGPQKKSKGLLGWLNLK